MFDQGACPFLNPLGSSRPTAFLAKDRKRYANPAYPGVTVQAARAVCPRGATDLAVVGQLGRHPAALATVAVLMGLFALVPGLPFLPFMAGALLMGACAYWQTTRPPEKSPKAEPEQTEVAPVKPQIADVLDLDDIHVEFAADLVDMVLEPGTGLDVRIENMRNHVASNYGLVLPEIRLTDARDLPVGTYVIRIHGVEMARGALHPDLVLALVPENRGALPSGEDVTEPVYGAPARWIKPEDQDRAAMTGTTIVTATEVLATHLLEVIRKNFSRLLTHKALRRLLDEMTNLTNPARAEANRRLIDEMIPDRVPLDVLHAVLRLLLEEQVSIRNLALIIEAVAEARGQAASTETICEHVRQRLSFQLVASLRREDGTIPLVQLAPEWEDTFHAYQVESPRGGIDVALPPDRFERLSQGLANQIEDAGGRGVFPAVVTAARRRRFLRTIMAAKGLPNPVMSFEEIGLEARPALVGTVAA